MTKPQRQTMIEPLEGRMLLVGNGLRGEYFNNADLTSLKFTRTDPQINLSLPTKSPLPRFVGADTFSVRWTGQIQAVATGVHTFHARADDGVRLWVRGQLLIDQWADRPRFAGDASGDHQVTLDDFTVLAANFGLNESTFDQGDFSGDGNVSLDDFTVLAANFGQQQAVPEYSANISLTGGQRVDFRMEFYDRTTEAVAQLDWTPPGQSRQLVPRSALFDSASTTMQINNRIAAEGADPWVVQYEGEYLYIRSDGGRLYVHRSPTLQGVTTAPGVLIYQPPPGTNYSQNLWAPELHLLDGKWYVYFAADDGANANHRMYVLEAATANPQGIYVFKGKIAALTDRWAIDGSVLEYQGNRYFVWSGWQGFVDGRQDLYIARMSNPWTLSTDRSLIAFPTYSWEQHGLPLVEGPTALVKNGKLHIIYSASGFWTNEYALGQLTLTGTNPLSAASWTKKSTPVFSKTSQVVGVGHASFVKSPDMLEDWIVFHAHNTPGDFTGVRDVRVQQFSWNADDSPNFGSPLDTGTLLNEPSGTPHVL